MKTALLKTIRVTSIFVTLWLTTLQVQGSSQAHELILPSLLPVSTDPLMQSQQQVLRTNQQSNTMALYDLVQELRTLPVGKEYRYYLQMLEQQGFLVLDTYKDHQHWEFTLEKMGQNLRLTVAFNPVTRTSTMITASGPRLVGQY